MERKLKRYLKKKFLFYPKTEDIIEIHDELYSIMLDKYSDCLKMGFTPKEAYARAIAMTADHKEAIKAVQNDSFRDVLKPGLRGIGTFTGLYFTILTIAYFLASVLIFKSYQKTWLIVVIGFFIYLTYLSVSLYRYAKLFNYKTLGRWGMAFIFFSLIPLLYVSPSLYISVVHSKNIWGRSWLIVFLIVLFYLVTDYGANRRSISDVEKKLLISVAGFVLTTFVYLFLSIKLNVWNVAWILYLCYLYAIFIMLRISGRKVKRQKD